jgi:hypothetical protein
VFDVRVLPLHLLLRVSRTPQPDRLPIGQFSVEGFATQVKDGDMLL